MTADSLSTRGFFRQLNLNAGKVCRRITEFGTAAAVLVCTPVMGQLPGSGFDSGTGPQAAQFGVPDEDEYTGQVDAVHSPNVDRILSSQYKLDVARRHSQLIVTSRRIRRIDVTHSEIVNFVQYSPTEVSVVGQELGNTNMMLWFEGEQTPSIYEVTVIRDENLEEQRRIDFGRLERRLAVMFPDSNVHLTPIGSQVHVRGQAYDAEEATQILQIVRTEVINSIGRYGDLFSQAGFSGGGNGAGNNFGGNNQQFGLNGGIDNILVNDLSIPGAYNILLRVVIAEINRSQQRDANVDLTAILNNGRNTLNSSLGAVAGGSNLGGVYNNGEITATVRLLATNGTINLVAEPRLVTLSGHPASLLGGGEFAVPTIIGLGGGQNTSFRGVGTSMIVTPTVIDRDLMSLQIQAEHSEINAGNTVGGVPGTNAKRVQTTVRLREGQTFAIGGLISRQTSTSVSRIPLLGAIPFLGTRLFHSKTSSEGDTELLILVSPEIVNPMEPDEVPPLPNFYVTHPNDHDLWKYARTEGNPDQSVYQTQPYGSGNTHGVPQGYSLYNPPVNGPGFQPGMSGGMASHGPNQMLNPTPQSGQMLPPPSSMHQQQPMSVSPQYSQPAQQNSFPPGPGYQSVPHQQGYGVPAPRNVIPAGPPMTVPPAATPQSPLPPVPQHTSLTLPAPAKPGLADRFNALFQKNPAQPAMGQGIPARTAGWRR